jgi:Family of unknown function (DUF7000)
MGQFIEYVDEYKKQLQKGVIQKAYKGLMEYFMGLRTYLADKYPDYYLSGSIYYGYMDMSYFSFSPRSLIERKLKIAIVFIHEGCKYEAWLAGANKQVQSKYWKMFKENDWNKYPIVSTTKGVDAIIVHSLVANPDFSDLDRLTNQIQSEAVVFIKDIESFLSTHEI